MDRKRTLKERLWALIFRGDLEMLEALFGPGCRDDAGSRVVKERNNSRRMIHCRTRFIWLSPHL